MSFAIIIDANSDMRNPQDLGARNCIGRAMRWACRRGKKWRDAEDTKSGDQKWKSQEGCASHKFTSGSWYSAGFNLANFVEAGAETLLKALVGGLVVGAAGEVVGEAGHVGDFIIEIVGVFVALAVADVFHETGDGVADVERHRFSLGFVNVIDDFAVGSVDGIGFWREREIDDGLGEGEMAFGRAEEVESIFRG